MMEVKNSTCLGISQQESNLSSLFEDLKKVYTQKEKSSSYARK